MTSRLEERFELSAFFGKTLLTAKDASADFLSEKSAQMLKTLSGDTGIKAEVKFAQQRVTLKGPFNIVIGSNSELLVALRDDAEAWKRRLLLLRVAKKKATGYFEFYEDKLISDEGPAILNWMLQGAEEIRALQSAGLRFPLTARQEAIRDAVLFKSDPISSFVRDELTQGAASDEIRSADLLERYLDYCDQGDLIADEEKRFFRRIRPKLEEQFQAKKGMLHTVPPAKGYRGVKFRPQTTSSPPPPPAPKAGAAPIATTAGATNNPPTGQPKAPASTGQPPVMVVQSITDKP
jgi:phage/plasmid-associated DNA primase